jgi:signal transduction histidine kinase
VTQGQPHRFRSSLAFSILALTALLAVLAALQYRWAGELGTAEMERLRASAEERANGFAHEFDRELTRAAVWLAQGPERIRTGDWAGLEEAWKRWHARAPYPSLVRGVYALVPGANGSATTLALDVVSGGVGAAPWPGELDAIRTRLAAALEPSASGRREGFFGPATALDDGVLAVVVPVLMLEAEASPRPSSRPPEPRVLGWVVALLDPAVIRSRMLPALEQRHFEAGAGPAYGIEITGATAPVYASAGLGAHPDTPDAATHLFGVSFEPANQDLIEGADPKLTPFWRRVFGMDASDGARRHGWNRSGRGDGWGRWRLVLWNGSGGLAEIVAASRRRNLGISFGILLLLGASVALLVQTARRAERLARQRMEFVASVTHELRTPLAVIRSAGENLADGVVADAPQVRRYGELVRDEGRRLTELVEEALALAGAESGRSPGTAKPVSLAALVEDAVRGCRGGLEAQGASLEIDVPAGLPDVLGDEPALRRALGNLLDNAIKYGGGAPRIRVTAGVRGDGGEAFLSVQDHGLGIARDELDHVFEPFYRSREALAGNARGSGLGLSLVRRTVEAHGGRVSVESEPGRGSVFTLSIPVSAQRVHAAAAVTPPVDA